MWPRTATAAAGTPVGALLAATQCSLATSTPEGRAAAACRRPQLPATPLHFHGCFTGAKPTCPPWQQPSLTMPPWQWRHRWRWAGSSTCRQPPWQSPQQSLTKARQGKTGKVRVATVCFGGQHTGCKVRQARVCFGGLHGLQGRAHEDVLMV